MLRAARSLPVVLLALAFAAVPLSADEPAAGSGPPGCVAAPPALGGALETHIKQARDRVYPALVNIQPVFEEYSGGRKVRGMATGSGVIFDAEGHVVTNYHVAGRAEKLLCTLSNKERVPATLIGADPWTDIAVIQLNLKEYKGPALAWANLGDSDALVVGDFVMAMGSPLALARSISFGIVSCKDRALGDDMDIEDFQKTGLFNTWIQTDAAINPGNSGGPLVDLQGQVVGINARGVQMANNVGFAIPINVVKDVIQQLMASKKVVRSWIGADFQPVDEFEKILNLPKGKGVLVSHVVPLSPAETGGLRPGDIILTWGGQPIAARFTEEIPEICRKISRTPVATDVGVAVLREGHEVQLTIKTEELQKGAGEDLEVKDWGMTVKGITPSMARSLALDSAAGVLITGVQSGGVASKAKLEDDDVILALDDAAVGDLEAFKKAMEVLKTARTEKVVLKILKDAKNPRVVVVKPSYKETAPAGETAAPADKTEPEKNGK